MRPTRPRLRGRLVLLAASCLLTAVAVLAGLAGERPALRPSPGPPAAGARAAGAHPSPARPAARAAALLHAWDVRRARAWADGDVAALRALYVPGSGAGERDATMLRAWLRRGLRVHGLSTQLLRVQVRRRATGRLVLAVTDRVSGTARAPGAEAVALPADLPTRRVVILQRDAGAWRAAAVRDRPG